MSIWSSFIGSKRIATLDAHETSWSYLGSLPSPPAINGLTPDNLTVQSVHSLHSNSVVVSYTRLGLSGTLMVYGIMIEFDVEAHECL